MKAKILTDKTEILQSLLNSQVGKGGLHNIVATVQSYDKSLDFVGAAGVADPGTGAAMTPETPLGFGNLNGAIILSIIWNRSRRLPVIIVDDTSQDISSTNWSCCVTYWAGYRKALA